MRVLFVAGEVAPFSETTTTARLMRALPEALEEFQNVEPRIIMPRYGVVSERRNRLHEVIRLSGAQIPVGDETEEVTVKVASIPGIRLQVYFMDSLKYFKRKGLHAGKKNGKIFEDNPARALFFGRAALETAKRLGWSPDIVHSAGWMGAFLPHLLKNDYADDALFAECYSVFTPDIVDGYKPELTAEEAETLALPETMGGSTLRSIGLSTADAVIYASEDGPESDEPKGNILESEGEQLASDAADEYRELTGVEEEEEAA